MTVETESADAVIVGGGPGGCTTAILLKRYNPAARVVLLEKEKFPRHHVGESTLPDANAILQKLGVIDTINRAGFPIKCGLTYKWRHDRPVFTDLFSKGVHPSLQNRLYPNGVPDHCWQVDRGRYDTILLNRAREVGVTVREQSRVVGLRFGNDRDADRVTGVEYQAKGESGTRELTARNVVDASGQARMLSRWMGIETENYTLGDTALYRYYEGIRWTEELVGSFYDGKVLFVSVPRGWMWYVPLSEEIASVGLVTTTTFLKGVTADELFEGELSCAGEIANMLANAKHISHEYTCDPPSTYAVRDWTYRNMTLAGPGWYLVGDAAAFVDPILASGVNLAHNCGLLVANAINTEWNYPQVPAAAVRDGYQTLYREIYSSFLAMAAWWYERRDTDLTDWWKVAREQSRNAPGLVNLSDREAFLAFTAGYVTDFRFNNIGAGGFGAEGLNNIFDNIPDEPIGERLHRPDINVERPLVAEFDDYEIGSYCGSHVGTDRWWELPLVNFRRGNERIPFHPSVMESEDEADVLLVDVSRRVVDRTLAHLDGQRSANDIARALQSDFGGFDQKRHRAAMKLMHNLLTVGLLRTA